MGDSQQTLIREFRTKAAEAPNARTRQSLSQAIDVLQRFIGEEPLGAEELTASLLEEFLLDMIMQGLTRTTISLYIRNLSALWGKIVRNSDPESSPRLFSLLKTRLEEIPDNLLALLSDSRLVDKLQTLSKAELSAKPELQLGRDLLLMAIYAGGLPLSEIARLKKEEVTQTDADQPEIADIITRNLRPRSQYILPLRQSERTEAQLRRETLRLADKALRIVGIKLPEAITDDIAAQICSTIAKRAGIGESCEHERSRQINRLIARNPQNWYAMQFRPGVSYTRISARLRAHDITLQEEYYPMQEIAKRVGKRIVSKSRPVVPGLLFFRSRPAELRELYYRIGDLAWGYRVNRAINSPYAIISEAAIATYQQTIGTFTADTRLRPAGSVPLNPGDKVLILGGDFVGRTAEYLRDFNPAKAPSAASGKNEETATTGRIIYRLKLIGENAIEWEVNIDSRLISAL